MSVFPYTVIYRANTDEIRVPVVKHDSKRPDHGRHGFNVKVASATHEPPLARLWGRGVRWGIHGACSVPNERFRRASRNAPCKGGNGHGFHHRGCLESP